MFSQALSISANRFLVLKRMAKNQDMYSALRKAMGYLAGTYVRDKDAVVASMLICEMAAYYRKNGKSLYEV